MPDAVLFETRGTVEGEILREARGTQGFGYDPIFFSPELGKGLGEASMAEKRTVSHRGRAFTALRDYLLQARADRGRPLGRYTRARSPSSSSRSTRSGSRSWR